jgi:hypothetical protein
VWLAGRFDHGEASHRFGLAPKRLQTFLAMEKQEAWYYSEAPLPPLVFLPLALTRGLTES